MNGTVKQFKDTLELMRKVYPFEDSETFVRIGNDMVSREHKLSIATQDKETGVWIEMSRDLVGGNDGN